MVESPLATCHGAVCCVLVQLHRQQAQHGTNPQQDAALQVAVLQVCFDAADYDGALPSGTRSTKACSMFSVAAVGSCCWMVGADGICSAWFGQHANSYGVVGHA
jgi:hypothetical protein